MTNLSYVAGPTTAPLWESTIGSHLATVAAMAPAADALIDASHEHRLSYAELSGAVGELSAALLAAGITRGDRVGVMSPNRAESVIAELAIADVGAILVGINPAYVQAELAYVLENAGISLVLASPMHRDTDLSAMLATAVLAGWQGSYVVFDSPAWSTFCARARTVSPSTLNAARGTVQPDDPFCLQYTSGTTGAPKGATITHRAALNNGRFIGEAMKLTSADRLCMCLPLFHAFGIIACTLGCMTHGAAMILSGPTFDAGAVLQTIEAERCTVLHGVPTMFIAEMNHPDFGRRDLTSLRTGLMGGAQCPLDVVRRARDRMHLRELTVGFGMSELGSVTTQTSPADSIERQINSVGKVHPHLEARIVDPEGAVVERDVAGELVVRGYTLMTGYWAEPERTAEAVDEDGWFHSGDLATIDEDGYVQIVGRLKDMILRGGENIYPREIEDVLHTMPGVIEAYVVGIPDDAYGEKVIAAVHADPRFELDEDAIKAFCQTALARHKRPQHVVFCERFPTTGSGKVRKNVLRDDVARLLTPTPTGAAQR